jgi:hypothetical protein
MRYSEAKMDKDVCCPKCDSSQARSVGFTWWGILFAVIGLQQVECEDCGTHFNGKTGDALTMGTKIVIAVFIICVLLITIIVPGRHGRSLLEDIMSWWG